MNQPRSPAAHTCEARPSEALRDDFLVQWRHALRNPLNAILAAAQVLEAAPADSPQAAQARGIIARQARQLAWLISAIPADLPHGQPAAPGA